MEIFKGSKVVAVFQKTWTVLCFNYAFNEIADAAWAWKLVQIKYKNLSFLRV